MNKLLAVFAICLSLCTSFLIGRAEAQVGITFFPGPGTAHSSGGGGFVGPGDLSLSATVTHYFGWSCVTAAYTGNAIDLADAATGNTTGTRLQCNNGVLTALSSASACSITSAGQTFITGGACSPIATTCASACVVAGKWDQIPNTACASFECDQFQNTNASRPAYTATGGAGGKACEVYAGSEQMASASIAISQPFSVAVVDNRTGGTSSLSTSFGLGSGLTGLYHSSTAGNVSIYAGSLSSNVAATDNAFHAIQAVFASPTFIIGVDGTPSTPTSPGTGTVGGFDSGNAGGGPLTGVLCEQVFFSAALSSGDTSTLSANQHTRFGF